MITNFIQLCYVQTDHQKYIFESFLTEKVIMDSQSRGPVFKTTGWLQGGLSLSSFRGR